MTAVPDDIAEGKQRYVCTVCDGDPLHDPRRASGPKAAEAAREAAHDVGSREPRSQSQGRCALGRDLVAVGLPFHPTCAHHFFHHLDAAQRLVAAWVKQPAVTRLQVSV